MELIQDRLDGLSGNHQFSIDGGSQAQPGTNRGTTLGPVRGMMDRVGLAPCDQARLLIRHEVAWRRIQRCIYLSASAPLTGAWGQHRGVGEYGPGVQR
jgi:hypothetical protein